MTCPYTPIPITATLAEFPQLRLGLDTCHNARQAGDPDAARQASLRLILAVTRGARDQPLLTLVGSSLRAMGDLTVEEIQMFTTWLPTNLDVHLTLCSHPHTTDQVRMNILRRFRSGRSAGDQDAEQALAHMRTYHPLATALFNNYWRGAVVDWDEDDINALTIPLAGDLSLQRVAAILLDTWEGSADALLQTTLGITAGTLAV